MKPSVSIIVPVYNPGKYLKKCLDSLLCQTCENIEIILIDDGSSDGSGQICDQYAARDSRVNVFHQDNAGVSVARNKGIDNASSDWIMFVDSDDWIEEDTIECALRYTDKSYDMILLSFFYNNDNEASSHKPETEEFDICKLKNDFLIRTRTNATVFTAPELDCDLRLTSQCGKLYHKGILDEFGIRFPAGIKISEDGFFNFSYLFHIRRALYVDKKVYHVTERLGSAGRTTDHKTEKLVRSIVMFDKMLEDYGCKDDLYWFQKIDCVYKMIDMIKSISRGLNRGQLQYHTELNDYKLQVNHSVVQSLMSNMEYALMWKYNKKMIFSLFLLKHRQYGFLIVLYRFIVRIIDLRVVK